MVGTDTERSVDHLLAWPIPNFTLAPGIPRKWSHPYRRILLTSSKPPFPWGIITHSHPDTLPKRLLKRKHKYTQRETHCLKRAAPALRERRSPETTRSCARPSCHRDRTDGAAGGRGGWKPRAQGSSPTLDARLLGPPGRKPGEAAQPLRKGSGPGRSDKVDRRFPPSQLRPPGHIPETPDSRDAARDAGRTEECGAAAPG